MLERGWEERNALAQSDCASAKRGAIFLVPRGMQIRRSRLTRGRNLLQLRVYVYVLFLHFPNITFTFFYMIPLSSHSFFLFSKIDHFLPVLDRDFRNFYHVIRSEIGYFLPNNLSIIRGFKKCDTYK